MRIFKPTTNNQKNETNKRRNIMISAINRITSDKSGVYSGKRIYQFNRVKAICREVWGADFDRDEIMANQLSANTLFSHMTSKGISNSSATSYIKALVSALNYSRVNHNIRIKDVLRGVRNKSNDDKLFLTSVELQKMQDFAPSNLSLTKVRDLFLFCAYTGMRHNEAMRLTKNDLHERDGYRVIRYATSKNNKVNEVPLNTTCEYLIRKWGMGNAILPKLSNSKCNLYLHLLLEEMGMTDQVSVVHYVGKNRVEQVKRKCDVITFHASRRSYASNLLSNGMSFQEVGDMMGVSVATLVNWYSYSKTEERNNKAFKILNQ